MIKGVVFDMDGVMFDTEVLSGKGWAYAGKQMGVGNMEKIARDTLGLNTIDTKKVFMGFLGGDFDYIAAQKMKIAYMDFYIEENGMPIKPGLIELLDFLKSRGYKMTVATSSDRVRAEYYFEKAEISGYFNKFICGDMIKKGKPEPDIYLKACEILELPADECLAFEDSPNGILAAHRAGMKPVMIPDLIEVNREIENLLYAKLATLSEAIGLLTADI